MPIEDLYLLKESCQINLSPGEDVQVDFKLRKNHPFVNPCISGTVTAGGKAVKNCMVVLFDRHFMLIYRTVTSDNGRFAFYNIFPGCYNVAANASGFIMSKARSVRIGPCCTKEILLHLEADHTIKKGFVYGIIFNRKTYAPIENANIQIFQKDNLKLAGETFSNSSGHYLFYDLEPGIYCMEATKNHFCDVACAQVQIEAGKYKKMNLSL